MLELVFNINKLYKKVKGSKKMTESALPFPFKICYLQGMGELTPFTMNLKLRYACGYDTSLVNGVGPGQTQQLIDY